MFFEVKFLKLIKKIFARKMQTTRQKSAILKFEWAAIIFSCCRRGSSTDVKQKFFVKLLHCLTEEKKKSTIPISPMSRRFSIIFWIDFYI